MKNRVLAAVILMLLAGVFLYFWFWPVAGKKTFRSGYEISSAVVVSNAPANQNPAAGAIVATNFAPVPALAGGVDGANGLTSLSFTNFPPAIVLENMGRAIRQYSSLFGGNPVGTNLEITRQLAGGNPKHINFLNAEAGMRVNGNGELVDPWGQPYFFHQVSSREMEIRSAGADGKMWTSDDLVAQ